MEQEPVSRMKEMNQALHIRISAAYWMDWKRETSEKEKPIKVTVEGIYPHNILVKDKYGRKIGIPLESAAIDLRLTRERPEALPKVPASKRVPLDHEKIIKEYQKSKSGWQIARDVGWSDVSVNRIIREWKKGHSGR